MMQGHKKNSPMKIPFTKMQGAGNDFVVLDETKGLFHLSKAQYQFLANRHFGVGADQILSIRPAPMGADPSIDFSYVIHNSNGGEVEHCGNGARCFVRYAIDKGLTQKSSITVQTQNRVLTLHALDDGSVEVDMGEPQLGSEAVYLDTRHLSKQLVGEVELWQLKEESLGLESWLACASMGNPHAMQIVTDIESPTIDALGPWVSTHPMFKQGVNASFMKIISPSHVQLRVCERGAGETLACGTGACAAVALGIKMGLLSTDTQVDMRGGQLRIKWQGEGHSLFLCGPATFVFDAEITIPDNIQSL